MRTARRAVATSWKGALLLVALPLVTAPLAAQRSVEIAVLGGPVRSAAQEFERVTGSGPFPPVYTRERGSRESGTALAATATFPWRGRWFAELGLLHHGVDRTVERTADGNSQGPFVQTRTIAGAVTSIWAGPAYQLVNGERFTLRALVAPAVFRIQGDAYAESEVGLSAAGKSTEVGFLLGIRARQWVSDRIGIQLSAEGAAWAVRLKDHPGESIFDSETFTDTPPSFDLRVLLGAAYRFGR